MFFKSIQTNAKEYFTTGKNVGAAVKNVGTAEISYISR